MTATGSSFWARSTTRTVVQRAQNDQGVDVPWFWAGPSPDTVVQRAQNGWDRVAAR